MESTGNAALDDRGTSSGRTPLEFWRFGGTPVPAARVGDLAAWLEELGWDGLAVGEDAGVIAEPYVYLAAAASRTSTLRLGTGVSVPFRAPIQAASAIATLAAVSGNRFEPSFGRGDGGVAVVGDRPSTVDAFVDYVEQVKAYLDHRAVDVNGFTSTMQRLYDSDDSLSGVRPLLNVSATGPRMISFGATATDGVTFAVGADLERLRQCVERARAARREAGMDIDGLRLGAYVPMAVHHGDPREARDVIRGAVLRHARFSAFHGKAADGLSDQDRDAILRTFEATRDHDLKGPKPADFSVAAVVDDDFVDRFAIVGTPDECVERLQQIVDTGVRRVVLLTRVPGTDPEERNAEAIAREVLPLVRREVAIAGTTV